MSLSSATRPISHSFSSKTEVSSEMVPPCTAAGAMALEYTDIRFFSMWLQNSLWIFGFCPGLFLVALPLSLYPSVPLPTTLGQLTAHRSRCAGRPSYWVSQGKVLDSAGDGRESRRLEIELQGAL